MTFDCHLIKHTDTKFHVYLLYTTTKRLIKCSTVAHVCTNYAGIRNLIEIKKTEDII